MSYAKDWTYIYVYHTKLIKKQKQAFKIEKTDYYLFLKFNLLTPFDYNWSQYQSMVYFSFFPVLGIIIWTSKKGISPRKMKISKK